MRVDDWGDDDLDIMELAETTQVTQPAAPGQEPQQPRSTDVTATHSDRNAYNGWGGQPSHGNEKVARSQAQPHEGVLLEESFNYDDEDWS